jgi:hypothetical protein
MPKIQPQEVEEGPTDNRNNNTFRPLSKKRLADSTFFGSRRRAPANMIRQGTPHLLIELAIFPVHQPYKPMLLYDPTIPAETCRVTTAMMLHMRIMSP